MFELGESSWIFDISTALLKELLVISLKVILQKSTLLWWENIDSLNNIRSLQCDMIQFSRVVYMYQCLIGFISMQFNSIYIYIYLLCRQIVYKMKKVGDGATRLAFIIVFNNVFEDKLCGLLHKLNLLILITKQTRHIISALFSALVGLAA